METLMATAFGQDVAVQRGEGDQVTKAANTVFRAAEEGSAISLEFLTFILCKPLFYMLYSMTYTV